jgi:hypothetical protein
MHLLPGANAHSPDSSAVDLNAKFRCRLFVYGSLQKFVRVLDCVWMREEIACREPDFAIVRVLHERFRIIPPPGTNRAALQDELHRLFGVEFNAGLLDLAVR